MHASHRTLNRALVPAAALSLLVGCRDKTPRPDHGPVGDSSFAQDLALAQRNVAAPLVFNDAPVGATGSVSHDSAAPRAVIPGPRPAARRAVSEAPVSRTRPSVARPSVARPTIPTAAPGPMNGVIGAGTQFGLTTNGRICAGTALSGDKFTATVTNTVTGTRGVAIPAGSTVVLEVASIDKADPIEDSRISFRVRAIDVEGVPHPADGNVASLAGLEPVQGSEGNVRRKVIGGAVAGAILGRILGGSARATVIGGAVGAAAGTAVGRHGPSSDACLPDGSSLRLTLSREVILVPAGAL